MWRAFAHACGLGMPRTSRKIEVGSHAKGSGAAAVVPQRARPTLGVGAQTHARARPRCDRAVGVGHDVGFLHRQCALPLPGGRQCGVQRSCFSGFRRADLFRADADLRRGMAQRPGLGRRYQSARRHLGGHGGKAHHRAWPRQQQYRDGRACRVTGSGRLAAAQRLCPAQGAVAASAPRRDRRHAGAGARDQERGRDRHAGPGCRAR